MITLLKRFCYQSSFNNTCYFLASPPIPQNYATQLSSKKKHLKLTMVSIPRKIYEETHFIVIAELQDVQSQSTWHNLYVSNNL